MTKKSILHFTEVDNHWYESAEKCAYGISDNNGPYLKKELRSKTWSVISKSTQKVLITKKLRSEVKEWLEKKTGKTIQFVSLKKFQSLEV